MKIHRGELLKKYFDKSGLSRVVFCNSMNISDNTFTNWCNSPELGFEKLLMAEPIVLHDFSEEIPGLKFLTYDKDLNALIVKEPVEAYKAATSESNEALIQAVSELKKDNNKIIQLLEKLISSNPDN